MIFVGLDTNNYIQSLVDKIDFEIRSRIKVTGWVEKDIYDAYLHRADVAVQLRANSRGETSGTVLDCLNHSIPTIVNANGSFSELPTDGVVLLDDLFALDQLVSALEFFYQNPSAASEIASVGHSWLLSNNSPTLCAELYSQAIECCYNDSLSFIDIFQDKLSL